MKNKLFKINAWFLLLTLTVKPVSLFAMEQKDKGFGSGFKKGFFGSVPKKKVSVQKKKSSVPVPAEDPINATAVISAPPIVEGKSVGECYSIWEDPYYQSAQARNNIYSRFARLPNSSQIKLYTEELLKSLRSNDQTVRRNALKNPQLWMAYIKTKYFGGIGAINDSFAPCVSDFQGFGEDCKASIIKDYLQPKIALQVIDDQILSAIFQDTNPAEDGFVTPDSTIVNGRLCINSSVWNEMKCPISIMQYYVENVEGRRPMYRVYFEAATHQRPIRKLPLSLSFNGYQFNEGIQAWEDSDLHHHAGYLLDKGGCLIEQDGVALIKGVMFPDDIQAFKYFFSPNIGQRSFVSITPALPKEKIKDSIYLSLLTELAGGVEKIEQEELAFIPQKVTGTSEQPAYNDVSFLLPYLYELRKIDGENELLVRTILRIENILADAEYEEKSEAAMIEIERDIEEQIDKEIERGAPKILAAIDTKATQFCAAYKRPERKRKWSVESKKAKDNAVQQLKEERKTAKLSALSEEEKTRLKKEKIIEKIRTSFIAKTIDRRHFDSSEVSGILDSMRRSFARAGIELTGVSATRGSHTGIEVGAAGGSVKLGLAKRPQGDGYQSGTVRTIINDHVDRILSLVINS